MSKIKNIKERNELLHFFGNQIAEHMPGFYGKIALNIQDGKHVLTEVEEKIRPDKK